MKKTLLMVLMALSLFAAPAAKADIDIPTCFPCAIAYRPASGLS